WPWCASSCLPVVGRPVCREPQACRNAPKPARRARSGVWREVLGRRAADIVPRRRRHRAPGETALSHEFATSGTARRAAALALCILTAAARADDASAGVEAPRLAVATAGSLAVSD